MEDPRIISALFIFLKMAYYNVLINKRCAESWGKETEEVERVLKEALENEK